MFVCRIKIAVTVASLMICSQVFAQHPLRNGDHARRDLGEVLIFSEELNRIVIAMDTDDKDDLVDQWYVFQPNVPAQPVRIHLRNADVFFRDNLLRVTSKAERTVYEYVLDDAAPGAALPPGFRLVRTEGYGLSRIAGETALRIAPERDRCDACESLVQDWGELGGGGSSACDAGGQYSSYCSITSGSRTCQVSCTGGAFACCAITPTGGVNCRCYLP